MHRNKVHRQLPEEDHTSIEDLLVDDLGEDNPPQPAHNPLRKPIPQQQQQQQSNLNPLVSSEHPRMASSGSGHGNCPNNNNNNNNNGSSSGNSNGMEGSCNNNNNSNINNNISNMNKSNILNISNMNNSSILNQSSHLTSGSSEWSISTSSVAGRKKWHWQKGRKIGSGGFGTVYVGLEASTGALVAGKEVTLTGTEQHARSVLQALKKEIGIMRELRHANIVRYIRAEQKGSSFFIFMEFVPGGSLRSLIDQFGPFQVNVAAKYVRRMLEGLDYLHAHNVIHRDIKAANVLVNVDGEVKLADFGSAQLISKVEGFHGTVYWMAPEVIRNETSNIGPKVDVWSLGCTVIEILTGRAPFDHYQTPYLVSKYLAGDAPIEIPNTITDPDARNFIRHCLERDPKKRPAVSELKEHPFLLKGEQADYSIAESMGSSVFGLGHSSGGVHVVASSVFTPQAGDVVLPGDEDDIEQKFRSVLYNNAVGLDNTCSPGDKNGPSPGVPQNAPNMTRTCSPDEKKLLVAGSGVFGGNNFPQLNAQEVMQCIAQQLQQQQRLNGNDNSVVAGGSIALHDPALSFAEEFPEETGPSQCSSSERTLRRNLLLNAQRGENDNDDDVISSAVISVRDPAAAAGHGSNGYGVVNGLSKQEDEKIWTLPRKLLLIAIILLVIAVTVLAIILFR